MSIEIIGGSVLFVVLSNELKSMIDFFCMIYSMDLIVRATSINKLVLKDDTMFLYMMKRSQSLWRNDLNDDDVLAY
jgi:hypothetical protein